MALLQIAEPGQSTAPHQHRIAIGIDLGTTHSLVATVLSGKPKVLQDDKDRVLLPSIVHYAKDSTTFGYEAKPFMMTDPKNTVVSVKRFMGRSQADIKFQHPYTLVGAENEMPASEDRFHLLVPPSPFSTIPQSCSLSSVCILLP